MAKITVILRAVKSKSRADGKYPLFIRISSGGSTTFKSLGITLEPEYWIASEGLVSRKHPRSKDLNEIISERLKEVEDSLYALKKKGGKVKAEDIKAKSELAGYSDFLSFAENHNKRYESFYTYKGKKSALAKLKAFCPDISWHHFNPTFFRDYIAHLKGDGLKEITIHSKFKYYRQLVTEAQDAGIVRFDTSPFRGIKLSSKSMPKPAMTMQQLVTFRSVTCVGWMRKAQLIFLLQFNLLGMRIGDLLTLKPDQIRNGKLYNVTNKDKDYFEIDLTDEAQRILQELCKPGTPYLLPFITETQDPKKIGAQVSAINAIINEHLKHVANRAGIDLAVSTHMARRTWAQLIYDATKDGRLAQLGLGHTSFTTTESSYLQSSKFEVLNSENKKLAGE